MKAWPLALACAAGACATAATGQPQEGRLAANAPADRPVQIVSKSPQEALASWRALIAPHVVKARATYPDAKRRYLAGLPPGETFFVTTILLDAEGRFEQVFILVDRIEGGTITGRIFSDVSTAHGFKVQDLYRCSESEVVDWLISKPDGSEEGNLVGKFLDDLPRQK